MAISILYNPAPMRLFEADGDFAAGAKGYFYLARTTTPLTVYTDAPLATPHTWPVVADAFGLFAPIYIAKGTEYKVRIEDQAGNILYAADGIDNPAEASDSGDGGSTVPPEQLHQTGDFIWTPSTASRTGWVRANGQTISSSLGTGTGRANDDCEALFVSLWNTFSDALCPVTPGGRGANAAADWDAAKLIATLDMRGYGAAGLDDMGAAAANRAQVSVNLGTTNTSTNANVIAVTGLCKGMFIICPTLVSPGTKIAAIVNATTITLSAPAIATSGSTAARFSMFSDAIVPGAAGGESYHAQDVSELATHNHTATVTDPGHIHAVTTDSSGSNHAVIGRTNPGGIYSIAGGGPADGYSQVTPSAVSHATGITVANTAQGLSAASNLWTPTRLGTWFIKL